MGDRTPRGTAHAPALAGLSRSTLTTPLGGSLRPECDADNTWVRKNPKARNQARPPATSTPQSGPVPPPARAEGEANAPEGSRGGSRTSESESRCSRQGRPSPCPPRSLAQVGSSRSVSVAAGAQGDAGRPRQATPKAPSRVPRRSPSSKTKRINLW